MSNIKLHDGRYSIICICDGHGNTDFFSDWVIKQYRFFLNPLLKSHPIDIEQVLVEVVDKLQKSVMRATRKYRITYGGTTFTICVIDNLRHRAFFANLGDSPGFVLKKNTESNYSIKF